MFNRIYKLSKKCLKVFFKPINILFQKIFFIYFSKAISEIEKHRFFFDSYVQLSHNAEKIITSLHHYFPLQEVINCEKIRVGSLHEAYVLINAFDNIKGTLALGVGGNIDFEYHMAKLTQKPVVLVDGTITELPLKHSLFRYENKLIGYEKSSHVIKEYISMEDLCNKHFPDQPRVKKQFKQNAPGDLILKTDIEGAEWEMLSTLSDVELRRFSQIVGEFHFFFNYTPELIEKIFKRIAKTHILVHIHANKPTTSNTHMFVTHTSKGPLPLFLILTFVEKDLFKYRKSKAISPTSLDRPYVGYERDIFIGEIPSK